MTGKTITTWTIVAVVAFGIGYDVWVGVTYGTDATISWVTWTAAQRYPVIALAVGVLIGHLFWVQQTGFSSPAAANRASKL
jgi:hypothetical protein